MDHFISSGSVSRLWLKSGSELSVCVRSLQLSMNETDSGWLPLVLVKPAHCMRECKLPISVAVLLEFAILLELSPTKNLVVVLE